MVLKQAKSFCLSTICETDNKTVYLTLSCLLLMFACLFLNWTPLEKCDKVPVKNMIILFKYHDLINIYDLHERKLWTMGVVRPGHIRRCVCTPPANGRPWFHFPVMWLVCCLILLQLILEHSNIQKIKHEVCLHVWVKGGTRLYDSREKNNRGSGED